MSTTYGLYNLSTKQWIDLGKPIHSQKKFQVSPHKIIEFLINSISCDLIIIGDDRDRPDEEEKGWQEIGSLWEN